MHVAASFPLQKMKSMLRNLATLSKGDHEQLRQPVINKARASGFAWGRSRMKGGEAEKARQSGNDRKKQKRKDVRVEVYCNSVRGRARICMRPSIGTVHAWPCMTIMSSHLQLSFMIGSNRIRIIGSHALFQLSSSNFTTYSVRKY
jgi:hypothetical protein